MIYFIAMTQNEDAVIAYYNTAESKKGYSLFLGGTKHFGYYNKGDARWQVSKALRQMEAQLAARLNLREGAKVLDAGCGVGDVALYLAKKHKLSVTGIDILDFNIEEANYRKTQRKLQTYLDFQLMSYEELQFPLASFDAVYTMETFVHASSPKKVLDNFYMILKPGGKLVMFEYSRDLDSQLSRRAVRMFKFINKHAAMPAFQKFTHGTQAKLMKQAGFTDITVEDITDNVAPMMRLFNAAAFIPYQLISLFGKRERYINATSAVEFYRYGKHIKYNIYTAVKPLS